MSSVPPPQKPQDAPVSEILASQKAPRLNPSSPLPGPHQSDALLAELDELLDRMMALPVNQLGEDEPSLRPEQPPPNVPVISVTEATPPSPRKLPAGVHAQQAALFTQTVTLPQQSEEPAAEIPPATQPPEPVAVWNNKQTETAETEESVEPPESEEEFSPPLPSRKEETEEEESVPTSLDPVTPPTARPEPVSAWMAPLLWCDLLFRGLTAPMGAPGRWLRRPGGRSLLATAGFLMLLAAAGVVLGDYLGWTW